MMPNRSKVSKQITRRTGGYNKTGKGTTVEEINRMRDEWEDDPDFKGTPTPYNIRTKVRKKKKKTRANPFGIRGAKLKKYERKTPKRPRRSAAGDAQSITASRVVHPRQPISDIVRPKPRRTAPDLSYVEVPKTIPPKKRRPTEPLAAITTPSERPVHMRDPIEPEITAKRKQVLAERAAERAARIEEGRRKSEAAALARENERKTNWDQLTPEAEERRLNAQIDRNIKRLRGETLQRVRAKKRGPTRMDLTDDRTEGQKEADRKIAEKRRKREEGEYEDFFVEKTGGKLSRYKGGKLKKKKTKAKSKSYKKAKKTYGNHHGGKLVASLYD
jgi:hypothetical protein